MKFELRIVTQLPLQEIWSEQGIVSRDKIRDLDSSDVINLLRTNKVRFVIANVGSHLQWVMTEECYTFWKSEVKPHLADPAMQVYLETFPDNYCYFASEWRTSENELIILLTKEH